MLSNEDYNKLRKISDDIDKYLFFKKDDLDKAVDAGDRLVNLFYRGFNLYLEQREKVFKKWEKKSEQNNSNLIFFDKECDFDKWFDVVYLCYYPALLNLKQSDLIELDQVWLS